MPLQIQIEGKNYLDGVDIDKETFYEKMMNSKEFFKTSQPSPQEFLDIFEKVKETVMNLKAEIVVVGLPKNMDGSEGESAQNARAFAERLHNETGLQVDLQDERGTTITAHNFLNDTNTRGKKRKNVVDEVAATIILQNYLDKRKNSKNY